MQSVVVGEGTYGCVHKPSLKCKNAPTISYEGKLSKIMDAKNAVTELKEYKVIDEIDKDLKYHMGKPDVCSPSDDSETIQAIDKCKWIKSKDIANMKLLIMKDGGLNLADYIQNIQQKTKTDIEMFLIEFHRVVLGVKVLNDNGIVHHDLKPQNIVYNEEETRMNFIDFGHMTMVDTLKNRNIQSINSRAVSHWSFPMEMMFQNKNDYMYYAQMSPESKNHVFSQVLNSMKSHTDFFLKYTSKENILERSEFLKKHFFYMFMNDITPAKYNDFMYKSINTTDVYGLGLTLLYILGPIRNMLDPKVYEILTKLYLNAINPRVFDRYDADTFLKTYESILTNSRILERNGLYLSDHDILPITVAESESESDSSSSQIPFVMAESITPCEQSGKERNPKTGRCVKKCKDGYLRNATFNCAKITICPDHKEINPKTRRCVKKCKDGYIRNENFRCIRVSRKNR
jgi:serine/threonine protein kinase